MELGFIKPMECTPVDDVPDDASRFVYEVKLDGYRCCGVVRARGAAIYSRYGNAWTDRFQHIRAELAELRTPLVLDGEIVAIDREGRPSFSELQNWQSTRLPIVYYVFDIIRLGARDLRHVPLEERKKILADLPFGDHVRHAATLEASLGVVLPQLMSRGLEGIVAKRRTSLYEPGVRSQAWLKHRFNKVEDFLVGGYVPEGDTFSRLLIGVRRGDELLFVHKLKNGFTPAGKRAVMDAIRKLRVKRCPFANLPEPKGSRRSAIDEEAMRGVVWVRPVRSVEVEFVEWTAGLRLRHAFFRRLLP
jgi:bifunctional non-homologous end joining protein LigD